MDHWTTVTEFYDDLMKNKADPRVKDFLMMSSPWLSLVICIVYVVLVEWLLPRFMDKRAPMEFRRLMIVYNFAMVLLSGYIFLEFGLSGWFGQYSFGCQPVDYSTDPIALRMANVCWWFYFSKFIELFDTIFFVLRKKYSQVTFLHVFHHGIMPVSWWFGVKFVPGGFGTFHAWCNSFIHFMMYIYYGMSAMGPQYQKYLWWKKYMTSMQITQFLLVCVHTMQLFFVSDCNYPMMFAYWIGLYAVIFLVMFADFYVKSYRRKPAAVAPTGHAHTSSSKHSNNSGAAEAVSNGLKKSI
jgi:elongation of very long chain fatty acids protein 7